MKKTMSKKDSMAKGSLAGVRMMKLGPASGLGAGSAKMPGKKAYGKKGKK